MNRWSRRGVVRLTLGAAGIAAAHRSRPGPRASIRRQATPEADPAGHRSPGDLCLVLGDSIAAGIGASDPARRGFAAILHGHLERLAGRPVELINLAIPGETTTTFAEDGQLDQAIRLVEEAGAAGLVVSPIVVSLGANDLLGANDDARESALATAASNLSRILVALRAAAIDDGGQPSGDLIALGYHDPSGSNPDRPGSNAWWVARLNAEINQVAAGAGAKVVDLAAIVRGHEDELTWYPTDIHPTNAGHAAIARAVWSVTGYDTTPPTVTVVRPTEGALPRTVPTIVATADDLVGVEHVVAVLDGEPLGALAWHPEARAYLLLWDASALPPGDHRLEVRAEDAAGNVGSAEVIVRASVDRTATPGIATPKASPSVRED